MNILVLGSGGREHALSLSIVKSPKCDKLFVAPGNAGTAAIAENIALDIGNFQAVKDCLLKHQIDMLVIGPEKPLVEGIYDYLKNESDLGALKIIGPSKAGALLEGSKERAKEFMSAHDIPTAAYKSFAAKDLKSGKEFLSTLNPPYVLKADGLAGGKGVLILEDLKEAQDELENMLTNKKFGEAGNTVVIEEFLDGIELSVFALTDGKNYKILPTAKDYKRIGEGDTGLNTGGMGAISPAVFADEEFMKKVETRIVQPTIEGLKKEGITYHGFVFFGLMKVDDEPYVIEYNVRMGDPETEVVIPRIKNDLLHVFEKLAEGKLDKVKLDINPQHAATVMLVSGGYPEAYEKGKEISGIAKTENCIIFQAGTRLEGDKTLTNGGRVLATTAFGNTYQEALKEAYQQVKKIKFDKMYYRTDLGKDIEKIA